MNNNKPSSLTNLQKRILSAVVILLIFALVLYLGDIWFVIFLGLIVGLAIGEWVGMVRNRKPPFGMLVRHLVNLVGSLLLLGAILSFYLLYTMLPDWRADGGFPASGLAVILFLVSLVVASDTAAFFVGRWLGGPKLAPRLSPNKTWSGAIGGVIASGLVSILWTVFSGSFLIENLPLLIASLLLSFIPGLVISVFAQLGDLLESAAKRYFGVKDSGKIIPGHGGILDRIDSYLLVLPLVALMVLYFRGFTVIELLGR
ncbi:MAG: phosphatidate cytidylyltransferase [Candidatus Pacebacteria bacterium]|nr:phosphatidate cytidylyltransferase [Candidatus Paceibacterota bacterium]